MNELTPTTPEERAELREETEAKPLTVVTVTKPMLLRLVADVDRLTAERDRLREALTWAVGYVRCNLPQTTEQYPDMRNAEELVRDAGLYSGEFHRIGIRAELAEVERDRLAAENERLRAALERG